MSDKDDSDDDSLITSVKVVGITTSLSNLSINDDKVDESNTSNSTNDDIEDLEDGDIDGYKLINEANERRILNQKKQVKASINISEKYDILKKISRTNTSSSVDHSKRASISKVCTLSTCFLEANEHMLTCKECKRPTHYACTKLPGYQLALFTLKSYRIYKCKDCASKEVNKDVLEICNKHSNEIEVAKLENRCKKLEVELQE